MPILAITVMATQAQSWTNHYNGLGNSIDEAHAIAVDGNGNVFVTGRSLSSGSLGSDDYATVAYSGAGVPLWTNRYNGPGNSNDVARAIAVDGSGNVFVTGYSRGTNSADSEDYATIAYSGAGVGLWTNRYNGPGNSYDQAYAIAVDGNGNVFVTGVSAGVGYATIKYSNAGVPLWTNYYTGPWNLDGGNAIAVDRSGNVIVTGNSFGDGSYYDYLTIKYSGAGVPLWTNRYDGSGKANDFAAAIAVDWNGNVFVTGRSYGSSNDDYATVAYSSAGVEMWANRYNGPGNSFDQAYAIAVAGSGNVFVTGYSYGDGSGNYDYATLAYSGAGVPLWTNRYNGPGHSFDRAVAIAVDGSGNVFVTGESYASGTAVDCATVAYSGAGVGLWTNRYDGGFGSDEGNAIAVDGSGNVFVTGYSSGIGSHNDYATIRYEAVSLPSIAILKNPQASAGEFSFHLTAEPGGQFAIQVSTNLFDWEAIREAVIPAGGSTNIVEAFTPEATPKFYRARRQ